MLEIKGLKKSFDENERIILEDINLNIEKGEFISILGPSGCGKTTLLNIIAGIEKEFQGEIISEFSKIAVMFQEGGLFPWLNVYQNVEFPLKLNKVDRENRKKLVEKYLRMVHLSAFKEKLVHQLSGGMRQRVALARALAYDSDILLLDEPFSALDSQIKNILLLQIQEIWRETGKTFIFVTHNVEEAVMLSNRIVLLSVNPGKVKKEYEVHLPRPRTIGNREILDYVIKIQSDLKEEVEKVAKEEYDNDYSIKADDLLYNPADHMDYYL